MMSRLYPLRLPLLLAFFILAVTACSNEQVIAVGGGPMPDGGVVIGDDGLPIVPDTTQSDLMREIVLLHDQSKPAQLVITENFQIRAKVIDYQASAPADNALVSFAIIANDNDGDATLTAFQAYTSPNGEVAVTFRANHKAGVNYTVQLNTEGAEPVTLDIYVGDEPSGDIQVNLAYEGPIAIKNVHVRLLPGTFSCGQFKATNVPLDVLGEKTILGLGDGADQGALFTHLPVSKKFTVIATAQSPTGSLAAAGCVDGVLVIPGETNTVTMTMYLLILNPAGYYDSTSVFDFTGAIPGQVGEVIDGVVLLFNNPGKFLIDQIKSLVAGFIGEWVTDLAFSLFEDELASVITDWMLNESPDWMQDIFTVGQDLTQIVNNLELRATLIISKLSNDYYVQGVLLWDGIVLYWKLGCAKEGEPDFDPDCGQYVFGLADFTDTEFPMDIIEGKFTGFIHDFDRLDIDNHVIKLNYGKLILFVLNEMILKTLTGYDNLTDAVLSFIDCPGIAANFSNDILNAIGVSENDLEDFCLDTVTFLVSPISIILGSLALDSQLRLSGSATMVDEDDDLKVDRIIDGKYVGHIEADGQEGPAFDGIWDAVKQTMHKYATLWIDHS